MTSELNFWNLQIWQFVITVGVLFAAMLFANMLRRLIRPLGKSLIPSSVLAGFIVLIADGIYKKITGSSMFSLVTLESLTYHGLGLGVVAMAFRSQDKPKNKKVNRDIFNTAIVTVGGYLLQGVLGLAISIGLYFLIGSWPAAGILLPMGYGQGPGQAYNWGIIYQNAVGYPAFTHGASFGLSIAATGFISASIGGVIYLNILRKKGRITDSFENPEEVEDLSAEQVTKKGEIPLAESLDKLTVQFGLVILAYCLAFAAMWGLTFLFDDLGGFFVKTVKPLVWGFNFLIGMFFVFVIKAFMRLFKKLKLQRREYTNNFMLTRISGMMFDIMVTASIAAINLEAFKYKEFIIPLICLSAVGLVATFLFVNYTSKKLFPDYPTNSFWLCTVC
jgi:ESS family glutamate:Na+ symporter